MLSCSGLTASFGLVLSPNSSACSQPLVDPSNVPDHDGFEHRLFDVSNNLVDRLLEEAWLQHVAAQAQTKKNDLVGLDQTLTLLGHKSLPAKFLPWVRAPQSGALATCELRQKEATCAPILPGSRQSEALAPLPTFFAAPHFAEAPDCVTLCSSWHPVHLLHLRSKGTLPLCLILIGYQIDEWY